MAPAPTLLAVSGLLGAAGVALGAFGAHGLKARLDAGALETWQTAVSYHLFHVLALLVLAAWLRGAGAAVTDSAVSVAALAFVLGILLFSGSLYGLALGGPRWLGPVTPLGGSAFIVGWLALCWAGLRAASSP